MFRPQSNRFVSLRNRRRIAPLVVEHLEDRVTPATYTVTGLADGVGVITANGADFNATTLRAAVNAANADPADPFFDTIRFDPALTAMVPANIDLSIVGDNTFGPSALPITTRIIMEGPFGANGVTIRRDTTNAPDRLRLFYVANAGELDLRNLTLSGGLAQGGTSSGGGGGAAGLGGAIVNAGTLNVAGVTFDGNKALGGNGGSGFSGGGGGLGGNGTVGRFGDGDGGGPNGGISLNQPGGFGGGGSAGFGGQAPGGFGGGGGGGSASTGSIGGFGGGGGGSSSGSSGSTIPGGFGGGTGGSVVGGGGAGLGGAVFNYGGDLSMRNNTFVGNVATGGNASGNATRGKGYGGAIFNLNGSVRIDNVTLAQNVARDVGGAIYNFGSDFEDTQSGPAINFNQTALVRLTNNILSDSFNGSIAFVADYAAGGNQSSSGENNIVEMNDTIGFTGTGTIVADPRLAPLGFYGGPTQTFALNFGSPAIDAGVNIFTAGGTDQRGISRPQGETNIWDIGAFESRFVLQIVAGNNQSTSANTAFATNLAVQIISNDVGVAIPAMQTITFTANPGSNGETGTFAPGTSTTDASNTATAKTLTANGTPGTFSVTASAGGLSTNFGLTITPSTGNTPPTISDIAEQKTTLGTAIPSSTFTVGDLETPGNLSVVATSSSNPALVPLSGIAIVTVAGGTRRLTITPTAGAFGRATITLMVTDGDGAITTRTFTVFVNTPPVISNIVDFSTVRGAAIPPIPFTIGDIETLPADIPNGNLSSQVSGTIAGLGIAFAGSGAFRTLTITNPNGLSGIADITVIVTDGNGASARNVSLIRPLTRTSFRLTIGSQPNPTVVVGNGSATLIAPVTGVRTPVPIPFGSFAGSVRAAVGDVNGDGIPDIGFAAGPTGSPRVAVVSGKDGSILLNRFALEESFRGGVDIAIGDLNGDGFADLVAGAGFSGGPRVVVISGKDGSTLRDFFAYEGTFRGGVNVGLVDWDGDDKLDIVTGAGNGGAPLVRVFRYADLVNFASFYAGNINDRGGVSVSGGNFGLDAGTTLGQSIVTGTGIGIAPPTLSIFRAADFNPAIASPAPAKSYPVFDSKFKGGFTIGVADTNGDGTKEIIVGAGPGGAPRLTRLRAATGEVLSDIFVDDINFLGGIAVS